MEHLVIREDRAIFGNFAELSVKAFLNCFQGTGLPFNYLRKNFVGYLRNKGRGNIYSRDFLEGLLKIARGQAARLHCQNFGFNLIAIFLILLNYTRFFSSLPDPEGPSRAASPKEVLRVRLFPFRLLLATECGG